MGHRLCIAKDSQGRANAGTTAEGPNPSRKPDAKDHRSIQLLNKKNIIGDRVTGLEEFFPMSVQAHTVVVWLSKVNCASRNFLFVLNATGV